MQEEHQPCSKPLWLTVLHHGYAASGFDYDIHLMNTDGKVRSSGFKLKVTFGFGIGTTSNHWLFLPVTHFWALQTKDFCVPAFLNNNGPTMLQTLSQTLSLSRLHRNNPLCTCLHAV